MIMGNPQNKKGNYVGPYSNPHQPSSFGTPQDYDGSFVAGRPQHTNHYRSFRCNVDTLNPLAAYKRDYNEDPNKEGP